MPAPLPTLAEVVYEPPFPSGLKTKFCGDCAFYVMGKAICLVHGQDLKIEINAVCGYHVNGIPMQNWPIDFHAMALSPELTGLVSDGRTHCGNCKWFYASESKCMATVEADRVKHPKVDYNGCCARWERA